MPDKNQGLLVRTVTGLKWSYIFTVINVIAQIASTTILARLLMPKDYGLMAMGNVVLRFGSYFAQMGIGPALIQRQSKDNSDFFTAYIISFFISALLYVLIYLLAPLAVYLFPGVDVISITRILGISIIFSSISMVSISLLRMKFKFLLLGSIDFVSYLVGNVLVCIFLAYKGFGVWSLVVGAIVQNLLLAIISFYFTKKYFQSLKVNYAAAKNLLSYGGKYTVSTFLEVLTYSADATIVGHFFAAKVLGIYNRAILLVQLPSQYISANFIKVFFPTLNEVKNDKERFIKYYQTVSLLLGLVLFGICVFIAICANEIVLVLLGQKWVETVIILKICALAVPFNLLINYQGLVYDVYGTLKKKIIIKFFHLLGMIVMLYVGAKLFGIIGLIWGYTLTEFLFYFIYVAIGINLLGEKLASVIQIHLNYLYVTLVVLFSSGIVTFLYKLCAFPIVVGFMVEVLLTPIICFLIILIYTPKGIKNLIKQFVEYKDFNIQQNETDTIMQKYLKRTTMKLITYS